MGRPTTRPFLYASGDKKTSVVRILKFSEDAFDGSYCLVQKTASTHVLARVVRSQITLAALVKVELALFEEDGVRKQTFDTAPPLYWYQHEQDVSAPRKKQKRKPRKPFSEDEKQAVLEGLEKFGGKDLRGSFLPTVREMLKDDGLKERLKARDEISISKLLRGDTAGLVSGDTEAALARFAEKKKS